MRLLEIQGDAFNPNHVVCVTTDGDQVTVTTVDGEGQCYSPQGNETATDLKDEIVRNWRSSL